MLSPAFPPWVSNRWWVGGKNRPAQQISQPGATQRSAGALTQVPGPTSALSIGLPPLLCIFSYTWAFLSSWAKIQGLLGKTSSLLPHGRPQTCRGISCVPAQFLDRLVETSGKADVSISARTPSPGSCDRDGDSEALPGLQGPWGPRLSTTPQAQRWLPSRLLVFNVHLNVLVNSCFPIA